MKKIIFLFALVASLICSCQTHRANQLIKEYEEKYDALALNARADTLITEYLQKSEKVTLEYGGKQIPISEEEWAFISAYAAYYENETAIVVSKNWQMETISKEVERPRLAAKMELQRIPLSAEKEQFLHQYTEAKMYLATVQTLKEWKEKHS
ncbi:MAG TPA: hypothetical protein DIC64_00785 [Alphaproteobacteria bacterium]|nr:hypothetical protein [Alphaproteobacteria bacterium]